MHRVRGREVALVEHPARARLDADSPLLHDHLPLRVELPEDRVRHPVRLQREPELGAVGGELHEVGRGLVRRGRVEPLGAGAREDAVELVGLDVGARGVLERVDAGGEPGHPRAVAGRPGAHERVVRRVHAPEEHTLGVDVLRADRGGALEQEVLEQVGGARVAEVLLHAAHVVLHHEGHGGRAPPLEHEEAHPVVERQLPDREPLAGGDVLGRRGASGREERESRDRRCEGRGRAPRAAPLSAHAAEAGRPGRRRPNGWRARRARSSCHTGRRLRRPGRRRAAGARTFLRRPQHCDSHGSWSRRPGLRDAAQTGSRRADARPPPVTRRWPGAWDGRPRGRALRPRRCFPTPAIRRWSRSHDRTGERERCRSRCSRSDVKPRASGSGPIRPERSAHASASSASTVPKRRVSSNTSKPPDAKRTRTAGCAGARGAAGRCGEGEEPARHPEVHREHAVAVELEDDVLAAASDPGDGAVAQHRGQSAPRLAQHVGWTTSTRRIRSPTMVRRRPRTMVSASGSSGMFGRASRAWPSRCARAPASRCRPGRTPRRRRSPPRPRGCGRPPPRRSSRAR